MLTPKPDFSSDSEDTMDRIIDAPSKPTTTKKYSSPSPLSAGSTSSSESEIVLPTRKKPVQKVNLFSDSEDDDEIEVVAVKKPDKRRLQFLTTGKMQYHLTTNQQTTPQPFTLPSLSQPKPPPIIVTLPPLLTPVMNPQVLAWNEGNCCPNF